MLIAMKDSSVGGLQGFTMCVAGSANWQIGNKSKGKPLKGKFLIAEKMSVLEK